MLEIKSPTKPKEVQSLTKKVATLIRFVSRAMDKCLPFFDALRGKGKFKWIERCEQAFQELKRYMGRPPLLSKPIKGEVLYLYLAMSPDTISVALVREEEKVQ